MKFNILSITLVFILLQAEMAMAQPRPGERADRRNSGGGDREKREAVAEFQNKTDAFILAINDENVTGARRLKAEILQLMRSHIRQTETEYRRAVQRQDKENAGNTLYRTGRRSRAESSRRGVNRERLSRAAILERRLETQTKLASKLQNLYLDTSHNYWRQAREHESIIQEFERTLTGRRPGR